MVLIDLPFSPWTHVTFKQNRAKQSELINEKLGTASTACQWMGLPHWVTE
jgi:hypothetical protein